MTLQSLLLIIAAIAFVMTLITFYWIKKHREPITSFLQYFAGILFVVSGWVKAIDPIGTSYKMEQYFAEFEATCNGSMFKFMAPLFPAMSKISLSFSIFMIVLEIVVGIMLITGIKPKLTSWIFFLTILFFTVLTGYTYMTGYVPNGANFFEFSKWGEYSSSNMKVTTCGCFGDFIKLEPRISFFKDIFLLFPSIWFLLRYKKFHQWFAQGFGNVFAIVATVATGIFCFHNSFWDEPVIDFRPFKIGTDITKQKELEQEAQADIEITEWTLKSNKTNEVKVFTNDEYMVKKGYEKYPPDEWKVVDQKKTEPSVPSTTISDFIVTDADGNDVTEAILTQKGYLFMIVAYKLKDTGTSSEEITVQDSIFVNDTIVNPDKSLAINRKFDHIESKKKTIESKIWDKSYLDNFKNKIKPLTEAADNDKIPSFIVTHAEPDEIKSFKEQAGIKLPTGYCDDIVIKSIMRSNPGVLLLKDGVIVNKWHINHLPTFEEIKKSMK